MKCVPHYVIVFVHILNIFVIVFIFRVLFFANIELVVLINSESALRGPLLLREPLGHSEAVSFLVSLPRLSGQVLVDSLSTGLALAHVGLSEALAFLALSRIFTATLGARYHSVSLIAAAGIRLIDISACRLKVRALFFYRRF